MKTRLLPLICCLALPLYAQESEPAPRPVPPPGVEVPADVRAELTAGVAKLGEEIAALRPLLAQKKMSALLPDVEIFHKSVDWALRYGEFFDVKQFDAAKKQLALGSERVAALREGKAPWTEQTGLVVRAYRSKIDGSVQPYGLVIPENWKADPAHPTRLDFWLHGRGEKLSELAFLEDRLRSKGEFAPETAIVCHLYGRFCNANKFAGEMDLFEALESVRQRYPVDMYRLVVRGFSMGGASTWQFGTHHAGLWAAVAPGAGFAETAEFFKVFAPGKTPPPWYEQVLWRWYDSTLYAANLSNTTVIAYSGELDAQKQAADIMTRYMKEEGLTLTHLIGPGVPHKYEPGTKPKIEELVTAAAAKGTEVYPPHVHLTTYSLIYSRMNWLAIEGMAQEWERADVDAKVEGTVVEATTKNVTALRFFAPSDVSVSVRSNTVVLDGQKVEAAWNKAGAQFHREGDKWVPGSFPEGLRKRPGLCGPIDHAFMKSFVMVKPTGKPLNEAVGKWAADELEHATKFWRAVSRGDAPVKADTAITDDDLANVNLVLWGDPSSNAVLAKIAAKLPIQWTAAGITVGTQTYPSATHAPVLIFPNPLNPQHYVVINSGITYREMALLNNSDQTPKLPDWAIIDVRTPPGPRWPGLVVDAGFFDEQWQLK
jgi:pimeloyl-ACP methyl ester carboxylesterase